MSILGTGASLQLFSSSGRNPSQSSIQTKEKKWSRVLRKRRKRNLAQFQRVIEKLYTDNVNLYHRKSLFVNFGPVAFSFTLSTDADKIKPRGSVRDLTGK
jgi:hypothetical protein